MPGSRQRDDCSFPLILNALLHASKWKRRLRGAAIFYGLAVGRLIAAPGAIYHAADFGVVGDGLTDCTPGIEMAICEVQSRGGGTLVFEAGNYVLRRNNNSQGPAIRLRAGVSLDGGGACFLLQDNCSFVGNFWRENDFATITDDVAAGQRTVRVDRPSQFAKGDEVGLRLGDNQWDPAETRAFFFARVVHVADDGTITLDRPLRSGCLIVSTLEKNRRMLKFGGDNAIYEGRIANMVLVQGKGGNAEAGVELRYTRNVTVSNITAENPGAGGVMMAYGFHNRVENLRVTSSVAQNGQGSKGRVVNVWNSEDCDFDGVEGRAFVNCFAFVESYSRGIRFRRVTCEQSAKSTDYNQVVFFAVQGSSVEVDGCEVTGDGGRLVIFDQGGTEADFRYRNLSVTTKHEVLQVPLGCWQGGMLSLGGQTFRWKDVTTSLLKGSELDHLPDGLWLEMWYRSECTPGPVFLESGDVRNEVSLDDSPKHWRGGGWSYGANFPGCGIGPKMLVGDYANLEMKVVWCPRTSE